MTIKHSLEAAGTEAGTRIPVLSVRYTVFYNKIKHCTGTRYDIVKYSCVKYEIGTGTNVVPRLEFVPVAVPANQGYVYRYTRTRYI